MEDIEDSKESVFDNETEIMDPFNPNDISIEKRTVLVETCVKRLVQGTIILSPDFQRHEVWDDVRKSQLIESLMLKIPIPMFYVSADEKNNYTVVDGLQRLSALRDFIIGKEYYKNREEKYRGEGMKLTGLEFWTQYSDKTFNEIPTNLQNRITETELTFTVINPGTPDEVKRNIFKRINTGGMYLTPQEIRNALYTGQSTILLNRLAKTKEFIKATGNAVNPKRMDDLELILRCLAFMIRDREFYPKNSSMDTFLSDSMQIINSYPSYDTTDIKKLIKKGNVVIESISLDGIDKLEQKFLIGMRRSYKLFGKHCFRRSHGNARRAPINKALCEMWTSLLSSLNENEYNCLIDRYDDFKSEYITILNNADFQNLISRDSWKYTSVQKRFEKFKILIDQFKGEK